MSTSAEQRRLFRAAAFVTAVVLLAVLVENERQGGNPVRLIGPGADGPSAAVVRTDFPDLQLPDGLGHDGQQNYAIARDPFPISRSAPHLDRPHYRLQRPLFPWLGWLLHPTGGGTGLIVALLAVSTLAALGGCLAMGSLIAAGGGPRLAGVAFAALPGVYVSLAITTADALALALALGAVATIGHRRALVPVCLGIGSVLAKEASFLILLGVALGRRDRRSVVVAGASAVAAAAWWVVVRVTVDSSGDQVAEFGRPFGGWWQSLSDRWMHGDDLWALAAAGAAVAAGIATLVRRRHSPLAPAVALQLAFLAFVNLNVVGLDLNGTRTTMPLLALALVALLRPPPAAPA